MAGGVINYANASQTIDWLQNTNQLTQASGWDVQTMTSELGGEAASNGMRLVGFEAEAGANATINFPNAGSAAEAFESFETSGGLTSGADAALTGSGEVAAGTAAVAEVGGSSAVVGVATGSAGLVAAAAAPLFGAALGYGLYELSPEFWTRLSATVLPWLYEDTGVLPLIYDTSGNTFINSDMLSAMSGLFSKALTLPDYTATGTVQIVSIAPLSSIVEWYIENEGFLRFTSSSVEEQFYTFIQTYNDYPGVLITSPIPIGHSSALIIGVLSNSSESVILGSDVQLRTGIRGRGAADDTGKNITVSSFTSINNTTLGGVPLALGYRDNYVCNINALSQSPYEGINTWTGQPYPSNPNTIQIYTGDDAQGNPQYETYQQVALPIGDPLVTNDPSVNPSPYTNPAPEIDPETGTKVYPAISPYISPIPSPSLFPSIVEAPNLNPAPLPSTEVVPEAATENVPLPETDPSTETDSPPQNPPESQTLPSRGTSPLPALPLFPPFPSAGTASLYHVYNPTQAQIDAFGAWLWQSFTGNLFDDISKWFNTPMDAVIGLQEFYWNPNIQGSGTIRCGYLDSGVSSLVVGNRYGVVECGSIIVPEYYGNYLDYTPYTQVIIYLPFIGFMSLNADDIIGNAVNVKYHVDSYTGSCIAIISVARKNYSAVVYQFEGNCSIDIPMTGGQLNSLKGAILGGISGAVMGGVAGAAIGAVTGGLASKNDVQHSGSFSATYGAMGAKVPFIVVRRPVQKIVYNYNESYGFPAHKMVYVGNCRGYLRAREVRVLSTTATNSEKEMIANALKSGVYVKD